MWATENLTLDLASRSLHSSEENKLPKSYSLKHSFSHDDVDCADGTRLCVHGPMMDGT